MSAAIRGQVVNVATSGAGWMFFSSLLKKLMSFALKQVLIRQSNPALIGTAEIQLELLLASLLFLTRESIRGALMRVDGADRRQFQRLVNLSWVPAAVLLLVNIAVATLLKDTWSDAVPPAVVQLYCLGALLEAAGEPLHNAFRNGLCLAPGLNADAVAVFLGSLTAVVCTTSAGTDAVRAAAALVGAHPTLLAWLPESDATTAGLGILGYGLSQVVHGGADLVLLAAHVPTTPIHGTVHVWTDFLPGVLPETGDMESEPEAENGANGARSSLWQFCAAWLDRLFGLPSLHLALSSSSTNLLKHLLTQSDKILLSLTASLFNQGVYAVTSNYASLVARIAFFPLEESARLAFSRLLEGGRGDKKGQGGSRGLMWRLLRSRLLVVAFIAAVFVLFGPFYARLFVDVAMSQQWRSEDTVGAFIAFCAYTAVLGANGVTEAFVHAVASAAAFRTTINVSLLASSAAFAAVTLATTASVGTTGVVLGNIAGMLVRIAFSAAFIGKFFAAEGEEAQVTMPPLLDAAAGRGAGIVGAGMVPVLASLYQSSMRYADSPRGLNDMALHVGVGALGGVLFLALLAQVFGVRSIVAALRVSDRDGEGEGEGEGEGGDGVGAVVHSGSVTGSGGASAVKRRVKATG